MVIKQRECSIDTQHGYASRTCSKDMQHRHAVRTSSIDMHHAGMEGLDMHYLHGLVAWTETCSMNMDKQHKR